MSTYTFISLECFYRHYVNSEGNFEEYPVKVLSGLKSREGHIDLIKLPKPVRVGFEYFARSSCEFVQPCYSNYLTVEELLAHIHEERGGLWEYYTIQNGLLRRYHREDNRDPNFRVSTIYPWEVNKRVLKVFRKLNRYGTFILGVDRLAFNSIFN